MNKGGSWGEHADRVLAELFRDGPPTAKALREAYPFGMRKYWPYKVWLEHVRWWKAGCPDRTRGRAVAPLARQERLL